MKQLYLVAKATSEERELVERAAALQHENMSIFCRRAILRELARLGLLSEQETRVLLAEQSKIRLEKESANAGSHPRALMAGTLTFEDAPTGSSGESDAK